MLDATSDFTTWAQDSPFWKPHRISASLKIRQRLGYDHSSELDPQRFYFQSLWAMAHWVRNWTTCLYLNDSLVKAIDYLSEAICDEIFSHELLDHITDLMNMKALCQTRIRLAAENILGCVDFAFGEIASDGYVSDDPESSYVHTLSAIGPMYMSYALDAIVVCTHTTVSQKSLAREALRRTAEERGIKSAYPCASDDA